MSEIRAETLPELIEAIRGSETIRVSGLGSGTPWRNPGHGAKTELIVGYSGVIQHDVSDQVVVVRAGTPLAELQSVLAESGQCIPIGSVDGLDLDGSVGGRVALNLPHGLETTCGSWRDWVLGMTVVRSDGEVAKCGSKAVKSVAGYDLAKLLVGSRGTLAVFAEVILRTYPIRALPGTEIENGRSAWSASGIVQRTPRSLLDRALKAAGDRLIQCNVPSATLTISATSRSQIERQQDDWLLGWGLGSENFVIEDPTQQKWTQKAKAAIDKQLKFNPGEMD